MSTENDSVPDDQTARFKEALGDSFLIYPYGDLAGERWFSFTLPESGVEVYKVVSDAVGVINEAEINYGSDINFCTCRTIEMLSVIGDLLLLRFKKYFVPEANNFSVN